MVTTEIKFKKSALNWSKEIPYQSGPNINISFLNRQQLVFSVLIYDVAQNHIQTAGKWPKTLPDNMM